MRWPLLFLPALLLPACDPDCIGEDCDDVPEVPWDPGDEEGEDDGYGYGGEDSEEPEVPREIVSQRDCEVRYELPDPGRAVSIAGEFNGWEPQALGGPDEDGNLGVDLGELPAGEYAFKLLFDGSWEGDPPANVYTKWLDGSENRNLRVGDCTRPLLQTVSASASADGTLLATVQVALAADGAPLAAVEATVGGVAVTPTFDAQTGEVQIAVSGLAPGKHTVRVWAEDTAGRTAENEPLFIPLWVEEQAFTWQDATLYFAFVDRFRNGDWGESALYPPVSGVPTCSNYQGGDFLGVVHALEDGYFEDLGVSAIWLTPVYENPEDGYIGADGVHMFSGYHGYWPVSATGVEGRFGDVDGDADTRLRELIAEAHRQGIRVMFDLVLNHVHEDHEYVSEHPEWFGSGCVCGTSGCGWDEKATECWFMPYLPDLNYRDHDVLMQVVEDTLAMLKDYDIDAVRIDAAKHMDHVIMRTLRRRLEEELEAGGGADTWLVGETFTADRGLIMDYVSDNELHGQFDFPLYYAIRSAFVSGASFRDLESAVDASAAAYGDALMSPFLGNHDIERFSTAYTGRSGDCWAGWLDDPMASGSSVDQWDLINRLSMAFTFLLTQPGVPLIYYGDEIGLHGGGDPDNRRPMSFAPYLSANQEELLGRVQAVGQARAASEALRRGTRRQLWVDDEVLVYARDLGGGDVAIVALNKGSSTRTVGVSVDVLGVDGATFTDALGSGRSATVSGDTLSVTLGSWDRLVLVR